MSKIHYTEKFFSLQGEGRYIGVPSVFLRLFGCNFRCKNFGRYEQDILGNDVTHNPEVVEIIKNIDNYQEFKDLPLVTTGCDSYSSIYPEFKKFVVKADPADLAREIVDLLPNKAWQDEHLIITGGEPLLGWQRVLPELLDQLVMQSLKEITFETNGTQPLTEDFKYYLNQWSTESEYREVTFSVSAKLSCSGESREDAIKPEIVAEYQDYGHTYLKLVVATEADVDEALDVLQQYRSEGFVGHCYLMPAGGVDSVYSLNNRRVADLALKHGLRYSDRLQVPLYKNAWGT